MLTGPWVVKLNNQEKSFISSSNETHSFLHFDTFIGEGCEIEIVGTRPHAPTGSITINNNAVYTNTTSVTLTLRASSGVVQMRFSHDNVTWSSWEPYSTSKPWVLTTGDGRKTVYVQFRDNIGLISCSYLDTIVLDTTAPAILITSPSPGYEARLSTLTVTWAGSDEASGISHYEIRLDKGPWINVGTNTRIHL